MKLHPFFIKALLENSTPEMDAPTEEWAQALSAAAGEFGHDALVAWAEAQGDFSTDRTFGPDELNDEIRRVYRYEWDSPAAFVRERVVNDFCESGEKDEGVGIRRFLATFGPHVEWQNAADDGNVTVGYTLIKLDPENSRVVHAFELDT